MRVPQAVADAFKREMKAHQDMARVVVRDGAIEWMLDIKGAPPKTQPLALFRRRTPQPYMIDGGDGRQHFVADDAHPWISSGVFAQ